MPERQVRPTPAALLRPERPADHDGVRRLHLDAFGDHGPVVAGLVDDLRSLVTAAAGVSLVAVDDPPGVVGHVMLTPALLDAPPRLVPIEVLSPLAVRTDRQRQGFGAALVRHALDDAARRDVPLVVLEGDPAYYRRLGFVPGRSLGLRRPSLRIPEAAFQAVRLPAAQAWMTGTVVYPEVFWRHDAVGLRDAGG